MNIKKNTLLTKKTKLATITLILLMTLSVMITAPTQAYDTPTFLFVTASPDPVGIGQIVYVGITFSRPTPTGSGYTGDLYEGITLEITDPTGVTATYGPVSYTHLRAHETDSYLV